MSRPGLDPQFAERNEEIVRRLEGRETLQRIADDYNITRERVRQIGKRAGLIPRLEATALKRAGAATWYRLGIEIDELSKKYHVHPASIRLWLRQEGVTLRPRPWTHGVNGYNWRKCRCAICRAANAERALEYRKRRLANGGIPAKTAHGKASTYSNWRCRCEPCKEAWRVHMRRQSKLNQRPEAVARRAAKLLTFGPERHGRQSTYQYYGCRCEPCRAVMAAKHAAEQVARHKQLPDLPPERHGSAYVYNEYGCRCAPCTEAVRVRNRLQSLRSKAKRLAKAS